MSDSKPLVGYVGQGFVGKTSADNFEDRGYTVIRYALEEPYRANKEKIKEADVVFIAVPTPTTPKGFLLSIVEEAIKLARPGAIVVIKSTVLPGITKRLQKKNPKITLLCNPEFLSEKTAREDTDNPFINVVGMPIDDVAHRKAAEVVHGIIPRAPKKVTCSSDEAEIYKYSHNISGYTQILTFNLMYDMAKKLGASWAPIQESIEADPMVCNRYANPIHKSGRGAGGACFIKDFAAFARHHEALIKNVNATAFMKSAEKLNIGLLLNTKKDLNLLKGVYGEKVVAKKKAAKKGKKR